MSWLVLRSKGTKLRLYWRCDETWQLEYCSSLVDIKLQTVKAGLRNTVKFYLYANAFYYRITIYGLYCTFRSDWFRNRLKSRRHNFHCHILYMQMFFPLSIPRYTLCWCMLIYFNLLCELGGISGSRKVYGQCGLLELMREAKFKYK